MKHRRLEVEDMLADGVLEDDLMEVPLAPRAFRVFFGIAAVLFMLAFLDVGYLSIGQHNFYEARARANMSNERIVLAPRGIIYDRYGKPLVENVASMNAYLMPRYLPEAADGRIAALKEIAELLRIDEAALAEKLSGKDWSVRDRVLVVQDLSHDQAVELSSRTVRGLSVEPAFRRSPKVPLAFSHIIGYTGLVDEEDLKEREELMVENEVGRAGLEAFYDETLRGTDGREVTFRDAEGAAAAGEKFLAPQPGFDLHTSIDGDLQEFLYNRLVRALQELGRPVGVAIALDPQNGEVLALAGAPAFDPDRIPEALVAAGKPLFNRAISGLYNPGSTIKPLVATAALTEKVIDSERQIFSKGYIEIPNPYFPESPSRFVDWKPNGWVNVVSALAKSSNIYFYEVGGGFEDQKGLGIERLKQWWGKFKLGEATGIDLVGEVKGFLPDPEWKEENTPEPWRIGDTYNVSIGQGDLLVTPLGLLNTIAAIANGGTLYRPHLVRTVTDRNGMAVEEHVPFVLADLRDEIGNAVTHVQEGMREVVRAPYGTAHQLAGLPFAVAAKTGTAQIEDNAKMNAFFVGYAPAEHPRIALLILVENAVEGSLNTVPVAQDVFLWYYNHRILPSS